jgi:hypothetical protein
MFFWVVYTVVMIQAVVFLALSLYFYFRPHKATARRASVERTQAEIVALEAQFLLAPRLALREARSRLAEQRIEIPVSLGGSNVADEFDELVEAILRAAR